MYARVHREQDGNQTKTECEPPRLACKAALNYTTYIINDSQHIFFPLFIAQVASHFSSDPYVGICRTRAGGTATVRLISITGTSASAVGCASASKWECDEKVSLRFFSVIHFLYRVYLLLAVRINAQLNV